MGCFTVRAVKACSFIIYLCKSQRYGTVFFPVGYQCSRSNISDELCPQLSKTACFQFYLGKCFQSPFFPFAFVWVKKLQSVGIQTRIRWFLINVPNWISMANNFFSKVQKLVHEHKHIDTRYWRQKKTKYITFAAATKTKPHTKNCAIRTKQMFCSTFFNGMKI